MYNTCISLKFFKRIGIFFKAGHFQEMAKNISHPSTLDPLRLALSILFLFNLRDCFFIYLNKSDPLTLALSNLFLFY